MTDQLVTPGFLFRWSIPVQKVPSLPGGSGGLLDLPESCRLPAVNELDGQTEFADVRLAWNPAGLGISVRVTGRRRTPSVDDLRFEASDGITVCIDTRNTQGVHRATRYCHQFCIIPGHVRRPARPQIRAIPLARAREEAQPTDLKRVQLHAVVEETRYLLEAWLPAEVFTGYDPATAPRLGFHYRVRDRDLGEQCLGVNSEFPVSSDPSLWQTLELID